MRDEMRGIAPRGTDEETITKLLDRLVYLGRNDWNKRCLNSAERIAAFLAIDEDNLKIGRPLSGMKPKEIKFLLDQKRVDLNELLMLYRQTDIQLKIRSGKFNLHSLVDFVATQNQRIQNLSTFKAAIDRVNCAPHGAFGVFAPTGTQPMAAQLKDLEPLLKGPYPAKDDCATRDTTDAALDAAEISIRNTAAARLQATPSWIPGTGRSGSVQTLYEEIVEHYSDKSGAGEEKGYDAAAAKA